MFTFTEQGNIFHVRNPDPFVLKAREYFYIQKFDTFNNGLNKKP